MTDKSATSILLVMPYDLGLSVNGDVACQKGFILNNMIGNAALQEGIHGYLSEIYSKPHNISNPFIYQNLLNFTHYILSLN